MMTLTEVFQGMAITEPTTDFMEKSPEEAMCDVVRSAITDAARSGRLTHGISECVTALQRDPKEVVICILPLDTSHCDVNLNIQLLLVESVCVEYDILVLKLDISELDSGLAFTGCKTELMLDNGALDKSSIKQPIKSALLTACPDLASDLFCCLIQHGEEGPSFSDRKLLNTFQGWEEEEEEYGYFYRSNANATTTNDNSSKQRNCSSCSLSEDSSEEFPPE